MAVEIHDFSNSTESPSWHYRQVDGKNVYRCWDEKRYFGGERTLEQVMEYGLILGLCTVIETYLNPMSQMVRNLTDVGWWTGRRRPKGKIELHAEDEPYDFSVVQRQAEKMASVALSAIKAYRAYVESGGDPSRLPAMSFEGGEFKVAMKDQKDI